MKTLAQFITEAGGGLSRVAQHVHERNIGMITAHRGHLTADENKERNEHVKGTYVENYGKENAKPVSEHSFLVIGKKGDDSGALKGFLKTHGAKYDQDSILHKAHNEEHAKLVGTNETGYPGKDKEESVGKFHPDKISEFYSKMKNKTFTFESIEIYQPAITKTFLNRTERPEVLIERYSFNQT